MLGLLQLQCIFFHSWSPSFKATRASGGFALRIYYLSYDLRPGTDSYVYGLLKIGGYELLHDIRVMLTTSDLNHLNLFL